MLSNQSPLDAPNAQPYKLAEAFSVKTNRCLFITGKAGTGKTTFLRQLRRSTAKNIVVVAPTGVAAINAEGVTIHSFFQLPTRFLQPTSQSYKQMFAEQRIMQRKRNIIYNLELLVIDEISMVRADVLDAIDQILRRYRYRRDLPFGGVQVVMIGDLMQLSPVVHAEEEELLRRYYDGPYFFHSKVLQQIEPIYLEFNNVFRQQNTQFVNLLNEVRENRLSTESRAMLAARYNPHFVNNEEDFHITLTTHNILADTINNSQLEHLPSQLFQFRAKIEGTFPESTYPTEELLSLKIGARVMFVRNDSESPRRFYNGKLGVIAAINSDVITVHSDDDDIDIAPVTWENIRYSEELTTGNITSETLGSFTQYPLRLAWAVTIHKSQGLTFDKVIIDAEHAFAAGQVYVALSRCRTLEGIVLSSPLSNVKLNNDRQVIGYISTQPDTQQVVKRLPQAEQEYTVQVITGIYDFTRISNLVEQLLKSATDSSSFNPETVLFLTRVEKDIKPMLPVADKFKMQLTRLVLAKDNKYLQERLKAAAEYFLPLLKPVAFAVQDHPCRCTNKSDATDFSVLLSELYILLNQKISFIQAVAADASIEAYMHAKRTFVAPAMLTQVYGERRKNSTKSSIKPKESRLQKEQRVSRKLMSAEGLKTPMMPKQHKEKKPDTLDITLALYRRGLRPEQIANERGLAINTIYGHLTRLIKLGKVDVKQMVPPGILKAVEKAQMQHPEYTQLGEYYNFFRETISYDQIRLALAALGK